MSDSPALTIPSPPEPAIPITRSSISQAFPSFHCPSGHFNLGGRSRIATWGPHAGFVPSGESRQGTANYRVWRADGVRGICVLRPRMRRSVARVEQDGIDDRHHPALGLRERQVAEAAHDALHDARIRDVAPTVGGHAYGAAA